MPLWCNRLGSTYNIYVLISMNHVQMISMFEGNCQIEYLYSFLTVPLDICLLHTLYVISGYMGAI